MTPKISHCIAMVLHIATPLGIKRGFRPISRNRRAAKSPPLVQHHDNGVHDCRQSVFSPNQRISSATFVDPDHEQDEYRISASTNCFSSICSPYTIWRAILVVVDDHQQIFLIISSPLLHARTTQATSNFWGWDPSKNYICHKQRHTSPQKNSSASN